MKIIKVGAQRTVIIVGNLVFKFPKIHRPLSGYGWWYDILQGLSANIVERRFNQCNFKELCPLIFSIPGGLLNVMPYTEPLTEDEWSCFDFSKFSCKHGGLENKKDSFGKLNSKIVAIDYG